MAIYKLRTEVTIEVPDDRNAGMASALRVFDKAMADAFIKEPSPMIEGIRDYKHFELKHESMGSVFIDIPESMR